MVPSPPKALVFENTGSIGGSIQITKSGNPTPDKAIMYSTDGDNWNEYEDNQVIATAPGDKVYFMSDDDLPLSIGPNDYRQFKLQGNHNAIGQIDSIGKMGAYAYYRLFYEANGIGIFPELPATELAESCYESMFESSNIQGKECILPATTLKKNCYKAMFKNSGVTAITKLPALELAEGSYKEMFMNASSIMTIRCNALNLGENSTGWVSGVEPGGTFYKNPSYTSEVRSDDTIPPTWEVYDWE